MKEKLAAIVIPVYKNEPSQFEKISFLQGINVLRAYDIFLVVPKGFDHGNYSGCSDISVKEFSPKYFAGLAGYNALLLSPFFYQAFAAYEYMFIYQLDCFVFRDELQQWCSKHYDYIGAPWINVEWLPSVCKTISSIVLSDQTAVLRPLTKLKWKISGLEKPESLAVGNGGLSLRNIKTLISATERFAKQISRWKFSEDYFFSIFLRLTSFNIRIPNWEEAIQFSFDVNPAACYEITKYKLPFGCHGWNRTDFPYHNNMQFWLPLIEGTRKT